MFVFSKIYEFLMMEPTPIVQFWPITDAMIWTFSATWVDEPMRVLVPMLHVLEYNLFVCFFIKLLDSELTWRV